MAAAGGKIVSKNPMSGNFPASRPLEFHADHRRFAIALTTGNCYCLFCFIGILKTPFGYADLPALSYCNPLLNNPSPSEYVASVRSSLSSSAISSFNSSQFRSQNCKTKNSSIFASESSAAFFRPSDWTNSVSRSNNSTESKLENVNGKFERRIPSAQTKKAIACESGKKKLHKSTIAALVSSVIVLAAATFILLYFFGMSLVIYIILNCQIIS